ncbi:flagellar hook-length control protein FliK [Rhodobacteraceae bacterium]|nr:flagellar hook-length control protein FliK [Paracoccaceae bacterium]
MQLLLQVLNKELTGDAAKPVIATDTLVPPEQDKAFSSLLENGDGEDNAEVLGFSLIPEGEAEADNLPVRKPVAEGTEFKAIGTVLPAIIGELRHGTPSDADDTAIVTAQRDFPTSAQHAFASTVPIKVDDPSKIALPIPAKQASVENEVVAGSSEDRLAKTRTSAEQQSSKILDVDVKLSAEIPTAEIVKKTTPLMPRPVPIIGVIDKIDPSLEKPHRIISREFTPDQLDRETTVELPVRIQTPAVQIETRIDATVQRSTPEISTPVNLLKKTVPAPLNSVPASPVPIEAGLDVAAKIAPLAIQVPAERTAFVKDGRTTRFNTDSRITVAISKAADAPQPTLTIQTTSPFKNEAAAKDAFRGGDVFQFTDDGPGQELLTDVAQSNRKPDAVLQKIEMMARPVITQIVQAAKTSIDGVIEVKLSPEELGRVRLSMTSGETGMTVLVTAERPETLELLRRNIDLFAADLAEQGFTDLSFSFGRDDAEEDQKKSGESNLEETELDFQALGTDHRDATHLPSNGRLDLRL